MRRFKNGDIVVRNSKVRPNHNTNAKPGHRATVTNSNYKSDYLPNHNLIEVKWEKGTSQIDGGYFEDYFDLAEPARESRDVVFDRWVEKLQEFSESETRVAPYSYIGFLGQFVSEWEAAR